MKIKREYMELGALATLALVLLVAFPLLLGGFYLNLAGKYLSFAFVAIGIVLTWGYGGILSLGQGIFFGLGGYALAMFLKIEASGSNLPDFMIWSGIKVMPAWWVPFSNIYITLAAIVLIPATMAFVFSYLVFKKRVSGVYFAIVTLALALTFTVLLVGQQSYTGGENGITNFTTFLGYDIYSHASTYAIYYTEIVLLLFVAMGCTAVIRSRLGNVVIAIRDREDRVRFSGYNTAAIKAFIFMLGALFASIGGAFFTIQAGLISPTVVGVTSSIEMVVYAAVGGRLSVPGAVLGALVVGFLQFYLSNNFPHIWLFFLGALFILVVTAMPNGLMGLLDRFALSRE
ncbi:urea ABC transporter permease subunit UrtC [Thiomonas sp.]